MLIRIIASCLVVLLGWSTLQAETLPDYYPATFDFAGTLQAINRDKLTVLINDTQVQVSANTRVHTLREKNLYLGALKIGQPVGVQFIASGNNERLVSNIWVLERTQQLLPPPPN